MVCSQAVLWNVLTPRGEQPLSRGQRGSHARTEGMTEPSARPGLAESTFTGISWVTVTLWADFWPRDCRAAEGVQLGFGAELFGCPLCWSFDR